MSIQTELLGLFQYEESDGANTFNIDKALNENWDKIDDYFKGVLRSDLSNADDATLQAVKAIVLSMVANNLTTTAANLLLDARQGKVLSEAIKAHLADTANPHNVTLAQIGAAAAAHSHDVSDIISGIFGVIRGGTGASTFTSNYPIFGDGTGPLKALAPLTAMALLGDGYGTCSTEADNTAKVVTLANFVRRTGSRVTVYFKNAVPKSSTLNVGGTGAAYMRYRDAYAAEIIRAGTYADFVFDGTYWLLLGISTAPANIVRGSYTGTGDYGSNKKTKITTGFKPWFMVITSRLSFSIIITSKQDGAVYVFQSGKMDYYYIWEYTVNDGIQFHNTNSAIGQLNESGTVYEYVAIG